MVPGPCGNARAGFGAVAQVAKHMAPKRFRVVVKPWDAGSTPARTFGTRDTRPSSPLA